MALGESVAQSIDDLQPREANFLTMAENSVVGEHCKAKQNNNKDDIMAWLVVLHPDARPELAKLPAQERAAVLNAFEKLQEIGPDLGAPHSSAVQGAATTLRELRPRGGRSPWRPLYRRIDQHFVVLAIAPEASVHPSGFRRAVTTALSRLDAMTR